MTLRRCPSCQTLNEPEHRHDDDVCILCRPGDPPWWRVQEARDNVMAGHHPMRTPSGERSAGA